VCKLWDLRTTTALKTFSHGSPVEDVAFFPSGKERALFGAFICGLCGEANWSCLIGCSEHAGYRWGNMRVLLGRSGWQSTAKACMPSENDYFVGIAAPTWQAHEFWRVAYYDGILGRASQGSWQKKNEMQT